MNAHDLTQEIWHEGEKRLHNELGVGERMEAIGRRVVRDFMPDEHREFFSHLPFVVAGSVDSDGDAWATFLEGRPGFMESPSPTVLQIAAMPAIEDPAGAGIVPGAPIGLLGIELHTRRRNRMNGIVTEAGDGLRIDVDQSFGNCPRYIRLRDYTLRHQAAAQPHPAPEEMTVLNGAARTMIAESDTFFVASYADRESGRQVDVSHRGGKTGFVRVDEDGTLTIPDFNGNLFFSTLGNILLNGKAGLLVVDFDCGDMLQMTGDAAVILKSPEIAAFLGAERLWTFTPRRIVRRPGALSLRWTADENGWTKSSLMTGDWLRAGENLCALDIAT